MNTKKSVRIYGSLFALLLVAVLIWQISPTMNAQKSDGSKESNAAAPLTAIGSPDEPSGIYLNAGKISVQSAEAKSLRKAVGGFDGKRMHLVKFDGAIQPQWYKSLTDGGLEIVDYIPNYAYLVYGDAASLQKMQTRALSAKSHIEWDGAYLDEYRIASGVYRESGKSEQKTLRTEEFSVQLYKDDEANKETLATLESLQTKPIRGQQEIMHYVNLVVGLDADGIKQLAARPDVISIQPSFEKKKLDEKQNIIITGNLSAGIPVPQNYLSYLAGKGITQAQFDTSNFSVNLSDSGIDNGTQTPNHFGLYRSGNSTLSSRIIYNRLEGTANAGSTIQAQDGHGNINAHIIGGFVPDSLIGTAPHTDVNSYRYGLGVAPFVKVGSSVIFDPNNFTNPTYADLESRAYRDGARISSNSWGSNSNAYTLDAQAYDSLVRDAQPATGAVPAAGNQEYTIIFAAGNGGSGANTVGEPGTAKNVITVGAAENVRAFGGSDGCGTTDAEADNANDIVGFSSRGPTSDGRKKPDISAPGTHVTGGAPQASLTNGSGTGTALAIYDGGGVCGGTGSIFFPSAGQQYYTASSGTSHSTPAVAGAAALIRQHFINQSLTPPSPAMIKAVLDNSARYMTGVAANDTLPSNVQGMGEVSLNNFFDIFATPRVIKDQLSANKFTASGQQRTVSGTIPDSTKPFRVTLAWTDKPGSTTGSAVVNNLDLEVTANGQTYKGNVFSGAVSAAGGTADAVNNVESVVLPAGVTGNYIIKIKATNIAGDGVPNDADVLDQDYALVVYNATETPVPVVEAAGLTVTAESCGAPNGAIDPDETVTVSLGLKNSGTANTSNLTATLLATGGVTSPSGAQNYGALAFGGATVTRNFTFTAAALCGQNLAITLQLQDGAANLGTVVQNVRIGLLGAPSTSLQTSGNIAVVVPDPGTIDIPINVTQTGSIADLNVRVRANHTYDSDLTIDLVAPDGTTANLINRRGTTLDNFGSGANDCSGTPTVLDDSAATAISAGTAPFAGTFKPDSPLSVFNGKTLNGIWKLRITDAESPDQGTVGCVQLEFSRQPFVCCGVSGTPAIASGGGAALVSESVTPTNSTPDPGETVTVNLPVINTGDGPTRNLIGTLQATGGVLTPSNPQSYGVVAAGGAAVPKPFTFVANGTCGTNITLTLALQDGAVSYGTVTYTMRLGTVSTTSVTGQNFDGVTAPALPAGWTTTHTGSELDWVTSTTNPVSALNNAFAPDVTTVGNTELLTPSISIPADGAQLSFKNLFNMESGFDGAVLEISINGGAFTDITSGGNAFTAGGYTRAISSGFSSPIAGRQAWSGLSAGTTAAPTYITSTINLPAAAAGQPIVLKWRAATDTSAVAAGLAGVRIDDIVITTSSNVCNSQTCSVVAPNITTYAYSSPGSGTTVNYGDFTLPSVTGSCGVLNYNPPSGSFFPIGTTTVNVTSTNLVDPTPQAATAASSFNVTVQPLNPTAASATITGAVQNTSGRGIAGALVTLTDSQGRAKTARTNPFGYFRLTEINTGSTYIANVTAKNYRFAPQVLTVNEDATALRFVAAP